MRTLGLLLALVVLPIAAAHAQEIDAPDGTIIRSAELSGFAFDRLSPGLRQDIDALVGDRVNQERLDALADRIEEEHPDVIAAIRSILRPDGDARVVFLVAEISTDQDLASNINARYTVESVELSGIPAGTVSQALRDELQALVGNRLDPDETQLDDRLAAELPGYDVRRRIHRGSRRGRIRLVFEAKEIETRPWIRFPQSRSKLVYHSDQGMSTVLDFPIGGHRHRVTLGLVLGNDDDLIEEYSGYGVRVESRRVATDRLGVSLAISKSSQTWREATLAAVASDARIPEAYRSRLNVEPLATFAFNPHVRATFGVSVSELESLSRSPASQMASAAVLGLGFDRRWEPASETSHSVEGSYLLRAATTTLDSDLLYKRHLAQARYRYDRERSSVIATVALGRITGAAPLFERFSLGDSSTLRGWNKFDIAPAGGDRLFHQSLEYRHRRVAFFLDTGSIRERDADRRIRVATGFGYHSDTGFVTFGFPLNASDVRATFMMGVRF